MDKNYLLKLLNQFHEADGTTNLTKIDEEFLNWLKEYQKILLQFKEYYESIGLSIDEWDSYELGKGNLDSVILDKSHTISLCGSDKLEIFVMENLPMRISKDGIKAINDSDLFYTYNFYTMRDIDSIRLLQKLGEFISISVVGKNFDKDKFFKIKLFDTQFSDYETKCNYEEFGDNYFYTLYTPRYIKAKKLRR